MPFKIQLTQFSWLLFVWFSTKNYLDVNVGKVELITIEEFSGFYEDKENEQYNVEEGMFVKVSQRCRNSNYMNDMG